MKIGLVEPLISALEDESWGVREDAAYALGAIGDVSAVEEISGALHIKRELVDELIENGDLYEPEEF